MERTYKRAWNALLQSIVKWVWVNSDFTTSFSFMYFFSDQMIFLRWKQLLFLPQQSTGKWLVLFIILQNNFLHAEQNNSHEQCQKNTYAVVHGNCIKITHKRAWNALLQSIVKWEWLNNNFTTSFSCIYFFQIKWFSRVEKNMVSTTTKRG